MGDTKIVCSDCGVTFEPPKWVDLSSTSGGGLLGGAAGSSVGIAAFGTAISGLAPLAAAGGIAGYAASQKVTKCTECGKWQTR